MDLRDESDSGFRYLRSVNRRTLTKSKTKIKKPLLAAEIKLLYDTCFQDCQRIYLSYVYRSGLMDDSVEPCDLRSEAYLHFKNATNKFDKSKCGRIRKENHKGKTTPKTLRFYFISFFCTFISNILRDSFRQQKRREDKRGKISIDFATKDVPSTQEGGFNQSSYLSNQEALGFILTRLGEDTELKRFFYEKEELELSRQALLSHWGGKAGLSRMKLRLVKFVEEMREELGVLDDLKS